MAAVAGLGASLSSVPSPGRSELELPIDLQAVAEIARWNGRVLQRHGRACHTSLFKESRRGVLGRSALVLRRAASPSRIQSPGVSKRRYRCAGASSVLMMASWVRRAVLSLRARRIPE